mgnify:CR=1 FL=1
MYFYERLSKAEQIKVTEFKIAKLAGVPELVIGRAKEIVEELSDEDITGKSKMRLRQKNVS